MVFVVAECYNLTYDLMKGANMKELTPEALAGLIIAVLTFFTAVSSHGVILYFGKKKSNQSMLTMLQEYLNFVNGLAEATTDPKQKEFLTNKAKDIQTKTTMLTLNKKQATLYSLMNK